MIHPHKAPTQRLPYEIEKKTHSFQPPPVRTVTIMAERSHLERHETSKIQWIFYQEPKMLVELPVADVWKAHGGKEAHSALSLESVGVFCDLKFWNNPNHLNHSNQSMESMESWVLQLCNPHPLESVWEALMFGKPPRCNSLLFHSTTSLEVCPGLDLMPWIVMCSVHVGIYNIIIYSTYVYYIHHAYNFKLMTCDDMCTEYPFIDARLFFTTL